MDLFSFSSYFTFAIISYFQVDEARCVSPSRLTIPVANKMVGMQSMCTCDTLQARNRFHIRHACEASIQCVELSFFSFLSYFTFILLVRILYQAIIIVLT